MIHNTHFSQFIPPTAMICLTGTWTETGGETDGAMAKHKAATAETTTIMIPITIPSNSVALQGAKLASVEIDYEILTAACVTGSADINKITRSANGVADEMSVIPFSYDTGHDTAGERVTVAAHKMKLTITTPFWLDNGEYVTVRLYLQAATTTLIDINAAVANFTMRA